MIDDDTTAHSGASLTGSARQRAIEAYESARDNVSGAGAAPPTASARPRSSLLPAGSPRAR